MKGRLVTALGIISALFITSGAFAQNYPAKPIRLIIPFAPGGTSDVLARLIAPKLQDALGQSVVVENKPGASGNIGADLVAKAAPDGYTIVLMDVGNLSISPSVNSKLPFDIIKDFSPVTIISYSPHLLVVNPAVPVNSVSELIKFAKNNPGKLNYATTGQGSAPHFAGILFAQRQGLEWVDIPGKGGAESVLHVMSGQADVLFNGMVATLPNVTTGKLKLLAVSSDKRVPSLPDTPTVAEAANMPGFVTGSWQGVLAPASTPKPIVTKLRDEIARIVNLPDVREKLIAMGANPVVNSPEQFSDWLKVEKDKWAEVVKKGNLKFD